MNKELLRKRIKTQKTDRVYVISASETIREKVMEMPCFKESHKVFCYVSLDTEVQTDEIMKACLKDKELYVPKCVSKTQMKAVRISSLDDLEKGYYGIREPVNMDVTSEQFDLMIVPCLAAGKNGERLGHGAGYYDRFLKSAEGKTICLCFQKNITEEIEMTDSDVFMDLIITEEKIYREK